MNNKENDVEGEVPNREPFDPVNHVITKFVSKGIEKLSLEELAVTLIIPDFGNSFKRRTGSDWDAKLKIKVVESTLR